MTQKLDNGVYNIWKDYSYLSTVFTLCVNGQTLIQNIVEDEFRARVVSVHLAIIVGGSAFGTLGIGWLAEFVGFQTALGVMAILALVVFTFQGRKLLSRSVDIEAVHPANKD